MANLEKRLLALEVQQNVKPAAALLIHVVGDLSVEQAAEIAEAKRIGRPWVVVRCSGKPLGNEMIRRE